MISQAVIIQENKVLMVKQYVQRGAIVWNFPGGGIEGNETPEQACIREVKEETGFDVSIRNPLHQTDHKFTFIADITGGDLFLDLTHPANEDLIDLAWIPLDDRDKFDRYTAPLLTLLKRQE